MKRREFMIGSAAASVAIASARKTKAGAPTMLIPAAVKPRVISSANGNHFKHDGQVTLFHTHGFAQSSARVPGAIAEERPGTNVSSAISVKSGLGSPKDAGGVAATGRAPTLIRSPRRCRKAWNSLSFLRRVTAELTDAVRRGATSRWPAPTPTVAAESRAGSPAAGAAADKEAGRARRGFT